MAVPRPASGLLLSLLEADTDTLRRVEFLEPHVSSHVVAGSSASDVTAAGSRTLATTTGRAWTTAQIEGSTSTVELGSRVVLQLGPGRSLVAFLAGTGLALSRTIGSNLFSLQAPDSPAAIEAAAGFVQRPGVTAS